MCIQQIAYPTPFATCRQWRINNGAIGARAPGPRAPSGPRIVNKKNYMTYRVIINQRGYKRSPGLDKHISHSTVTVRP